MARATVNCYLPDDLKARAIDAGLNFSELLRTAVLDQLRTQPTPVSSPAAAETKVTAAA